MDLRCKFLVSILLAVLCSPGALLAAQSPVEIAAGSRDGLFAQSQLLQSFDQAWFAPLSIPKSGSPLATTLNSSRSSTSAHQPAKSSSDSNSLVSPADKKSRTSSATHFRWLPAIGESLLYTGIMHTFDLTFQAGTRDALNGHWFTHYQQSLAELRGWSDSDTFMAPYVGHPIDGSVFGYIQRQNDSKYHLVEIINKELREQLLNEWNDGSGTLPHYPKRSDYSVETAQNGPSFAVGGGVDVVVTRPFAWRLVNLPRPF